MTTDPSALSALAACFQGIQPGDRDAVIIILLQSIAGNTQTPAQLSASAACFRGIPADLKQAIIVMLLANIATAAGA